MTGGEFSEAVRARDWFRVADAVAAFTRESTTDPAEGSDALAAWLSFRAWDGNETPQAVAAEWDALPRWPSGWPREANQHGEPASGE